MPVLLALLIFVGPSAATGWVYAACFKATYTSDPDPNDSTVAARAVAAVALSCFLPFPPGCLAELVIRAMSVDRFLNLPPERATVLMGDLAAASVVGRLVVRM